MSWLVTGGAGYIGSHVVRALQEIGIIPVVVDNLSTQGAHREFVREGIDFYQADVRNTSGLAIIMAHHNVVGVIHCAGLKAAGESVRSPLSYYTQNVEGTLSVLRAMHVTSVENIVFSSSAAAEFPETTPYAASKAFCERVLREQERSTSIRHTSLRYFNVVGSGHVDLWDDSAHNLVPVVFTDLITGSKPTIYGNDYPTEDGTCIRDYVHVAALATAHANAARALQHDHALNRVYNLSTGVGLSVAQIMAAIREVTQTSFIPRIAARREGDPAEIVGPLDRGALRDLYWGHMDHTLRDMIESAWIARQAAL